MKAERALEKMGRAAGRDLVPDRVALDYGGATIMLEVPTKVARKRAHACAKEPWTVRWLESLPAGAVLYDVGANVGAYALIGALRPQGPLRVVAWEPGYPTYALLCANVAANDAGSHVTPLPVALSDSSGVVRFPLRDLRGGAALHGDESQAAYVQPALSLRLDEAVEHFGLPAPEHLKLDTDGSEEAVLRGAGGLLTDDALRSVMVEQSDADGDGVDTLLRERGLERVEKFDAGREYWYALYRRA